MFKVLFLILFVMCSSAFSQQSQDKGQNEKPKSVLFDEFGKISNAVIKQRTQKLRKKLQERDSINNGLGAYLMFYTDSTGTSLKKMELIVKDVLFDNCRDCYGFGGPRIVFVNGGKKKKQNVQFWLVPAGAEPPTP